MTYYLLTAWNADGKRHEMLFGDYDREVVEQERDDIRDSYAEGEYCSWKVRACGDAQADIDALMRDLNQGEL